ncbi:hypothetical protein ACHAXT_011351 [Thalassiosira profunda]
MKGLCLHAQMNDPRRALPTSRPAAVLPLLCAAAGCQPLSPRRGRTGSAVPTWPARQHQLTQAQLEAIEREVKANQALTSPLLPIETLLQQYSGEAENNADTPDQQGFLRAAQFLSKKYASLRKIRGDGNCYYRAFLYSLCEQLLRQLIVGGDRAEFERIKGVVGGSLKWVCNYGYDEHTIDMFHEELVELFDFIEGAAKKPEDGDADSGDLLENALQQLHTRLNEENACSDYCTWFLRVMSAAQMKSQPDHYLPFVMAEDYMDVPSYCSREVEPMGRECSMVGVSALAECLGVRVVIEYVDGRMGENEKVVNHVFGEGDGGDKGERLTVTLLYRPGHYDILY